MPINGPNDLPLSWKRGLCDALTNLDDWRVPQILVPAVRRDAWGNVTSVNIRVEACGEVSETVVHDRIVVQAVADDFGRGYEAHPHAISDFDPWDVRRTHPAEPGSRENPCVLPRPPLLVGRSLNELQGLLIRERQQGGKRGNRLYYVPPESWNPIIIDRERWRAGRSFPIAPAQARGNQPGYLDSDGNIWLWSGNPEREWDVQLTRSRGDHYDVRHSGEII